jgi:AraC-like DNA-binding protein
MEHTFGKVARDRLNPRELDGSASLRGGETLSDSVKSLLGLMIEGDEAPTMKRIVAAAGTSGRTFQRQLEVEGTNFSELLADVRRSETLRRLKKRNVTIAAIATDLGYSDQASFTRAFRRWTGAPPGQFRNKTTADLS